MTETKQRDERLVDRINRHIDSQLNEACAVKREVQNHLRIRHALQLVCMLVL